MHIISKDENSIEFELEGEDSTFPNALRSVLLEDEGVAFVSCTVEHPILSRPRLVLRTKGKKPTTALKEAVKKLGRAASEIRASMKKAKK
ncbi:MAG: DNA-directed RNA polymerase subunit L [Candidatus Micrarchaeota archaeon]